MRLNQTAVIWGLVAVVVLAVVAAQFVPPIFVVLVLVLLGLGALVVVSRRAEARKGHDDERWEAADDWGLPTEVVDEDFVDVEERLQDVGLTNRTNYLEPDTEVLEEYVVYETLEGHPADLEPDTEVLEEYVVYETVEERPGPADTEVLEEYFAEETFEEAFVGDELRELEELTQFDEPLDLEEPVETAVTTDRYIDEEQVQDDDSILAAAQASAVQYEDVLTREDANAETREILSRVASLLAKYE